MKPPFPWLALGTGLLIFIVLVQSGAIDPDAEPALPLLTLLILVEFGFLVTAIGAGVGLRTLFRQGFSVATLGVVLGCSALAVGFLWLGVMLWPGGTGFDLAQWYLP